jgi:hypothetical protein
MSEMAKSARKALKSKAERLVSDPQKKVDSSTWTPPEPLNADVKTGMRPVSRRAFKSGGKVTGEANAARADKAPRAYANAKVNRNVKNANEEREGVKHIGGMKKGGVAKKGGGALDALSIVSPAAMAYNMMKGDKDEKKHGGRTKKKFGGGNGDSVLPENSDYKRKLEAAGKGQSPDAQRQRNEMRDMLNKPSFPKEMEYEHYMSMPKRKAGGRIKKQSGGRGVGEAARNALANRERDDAEHAINEAKWSQAKADTGGQWGRAKNEEIAASKWHDYAKNKSDRVNKETGYSSSNFYKKGGRTKKMDGGPMVSDRPDARLGMVSPTRMKFAGAQGTPYKKGGKIKDKSFDEIRKEYGTQVMQKGGAAKHGDEAMDKALIKKMVKKSALEKCEGGSTTKRMARKDGGRAKGKTNINIVVNTGKKDSTETPMGMPNPGMPPMARPPVMPVPAPAPGSMPPGLAGAGAPPMGMPPGAGPGGPSMPPPSMMARKTGGRVTKIAKSYKDMEAGAGSGEGRLQKTDIAKRLPKPREDGKNVFDGVGYPNKVPGATGGRTARKAGGGVYRSYKDMDAGAGSGEGRLEKTEIQRSKRGR